MIQTSFFPQPEKEEPVKIIQINPSGFQPVKMEEINYRTCRDLMPDTYMLYPTGGYHPFYGVPNTFPRYQLPIWPYVKRIKWTRDSIRKNKIQIEPRFSSKRGYIEISLYKKGFYKGNYYTIINKHGHHYVNKKKQNHITVDLHGLVARAWIPNPDNKPLVLHINDDPTNYLPENLIWGTQKDNMKGVKKTPETSEQKYLSLVDRGFIKG
tara:strand:+ start:15 stop:644 length:630 start_codon:yes stop_codon:yes gene_type:complete